MPHLPGWCTLTYSISARPPTFCGGSRRRRLRMACGARRVGCRQGRSLINEISSSTRHLLHCRANLHVASDRCSHTTRRDTTRPAHVPLLAAPAGRWTLELLAEELVTLTEHSSLSRETVRRRLAENDLKPWRKDMWCIPKVDAEYVARMEDILDLYGEPSDPKRPVICFDESPIQSLRYVLNDDFSVHFTVIPAKAGIHGRGDDDLYDQRSSFMHTSFL